MSCLHSSFVLCLEFMRALYHLLQVGECELETERGFDSPRFKRELRVLFLEMVIFRVLICLKLPPMKISTQNGDALTTVPLPSSYEAVTQSSLQGSIRMAKWLSSILLAEQVRVKMPIRRYITLCSTGCGSNRNSLKLQHQVCILCHAVDNLVGLLNPCPGCGCIPPDAIPMPHAGVR